MHDLRSNTPGGPKPCTTAQWSHLIAVHSCQCMHGQVPCQLPSVTLRLVCICLVQDHGMALSVGHDARRNACEALQVLAELPVEGRLRVLCRAVYAYVLGVS